MADPYSSTEAMDVRDTDPNYSESIDGLSLETVQVTCTNTLDQSVTVILQAALSTDADFENPIESDPLTIAAGATDYIVTEGELFAYWRVKVTAAEVPTSGTLTAVWTGVYTESYSSGYADTDLVKSLSGVTYSDLNLSSADAYEVVLDRLNAEVADTIDTYCGQTFSAVSDEAETHSGDGSSILMLGHAPVTGITSVVEDGSTLASTSYHLDASAGVLYRKAGYWSEDEWNIVVTYDYGYATPPAAISRVAEEMCIAALKAAKVDRALQGLDSVSMDGFSSSRSASASVTPGQITQAEMQTLNRYRRVGCA